MSDFKKWLRQAYREPHTTFTEHNMEVAYLAGQASVEERVKELEQERDEAVRQWERFERMAGDNWAALKSQAGDYIRRWNIEPDGDDLLICDGNHDKHEKCEYIRYTPASTVKAQAGEPVCWIYELSGYRSIAWGSSKPDFPAAKNPVPLYTHPTTERPYNPLNDYAVIPMNPTEQVKAQAGESRKTMFEQALDEVMETGGIFPPTERRVDELPAVCPHCLCAVVGVPDGKLIVDRAVVEMALDTILNIRDFVPIYQACHDTITALRNALNAAPAKGEV